MTIVLSDKEVLAAVQTVVDNQPNAWNPMRRREPGEGAESDGDQELICIYENPQPGQHPDDCARCIIGQWMYQIGAKVPDKSERRGVHAMAMGWMIHDNIDDAVPRWGIDVSEVALRFLCSVQRHADADALKDRIGWRYALEGAMRGVQARQLLAAIEEQEASHD